MSRSILSGVIISLCVCSSGYAGGLTSTGSDSVWFKSRYAAYSQEKRDPGMAFILSWLIPGVGQFYNGEIRNGIIHLCSTAIWWTIIGYTGYDKKFEYRRIDEHPYYVLGISCLFTQMLIASTSAYSSAEKRNQYCKERHRIY
ncbi:MAG: hypothetical protein HY769_03465 [Candidatus Stahlbacteria bacterium]|nr:hypothetical protein [Candidatus Stahlbacteria bacterium]